MSILHAAPAIIIIVIVICIVISQAKVMNDALRKVLFLRRLFFLLVLLNVLPK